MADKLNLEVITPERLVLRESVDGLMDRSLDSADVVRARRVLETFHARGVAFTDLRTRRAGASAFLQVVVLVPGDWTVRDGHALLDEIEAAVVAELPGIDVTTHLEPLP